MAGVLSANAVAAANVVNFIAAFLSVPWREDV
jgi:hypothetical protein